MAGYRGKSSRTTLTPEKQRKIDDFRNRYILAVCDDINTPKALAVFWEMLKSNIPSGDKYDLAISFDEVLGLGLQEAQIEEVKIPIKVQKLAEDRETLRKAGKFEEGDKIRKSMLEEGYLIEDTPKGPKVKKIKQ